jgi:hypothetical protein
MLIIVKKWFVLDTTGTIATKTLSTNRGSLSEIAKQSQRNARN